MKELSIIIVNWKTPDLTVQCLESLFSNINKELVDVWVVDNDSQDESVSIIRDKFRDVILIENKKNVGFAKANNQVLRTIETPYAMLLNSDTIVEGNSIEIMLNYLKENPQVGAVGPNLPMPDGSLRDSLMWIFTFY